MHEHLRNDFSVKLSELDGVDTTMIHAKSSLEDAKAEHKKYIV